MSRLTRGVVAAIALATALALPSAAFAATSSSGSMTLTVGTSISVSGVPSTIAFGSSLGGETKTAPQFTVTYSANTSATFTTSADDLTASGGTIPKAALHLSIAGGAPGAADGRTVDSFGSGGGSSSKTLDLTLDVPAGQAAGSYTGTFTVAGS